MLEFLVATEEEEPHIKVEWRRTASFIKIHPLLKIPSKLQATDRHITKWRKNLATRHITDKNN